eukprot:UN12706
MENSTNLIIFTLFLVFPFSPKLPIVLKKPSDAPLRGVLTCASLDRKTFFLAEISTFSSHTSLVSPPVFSQKVDPAFVVGSGLCFRK